MYSLKKMCQDERFPASQREYFFEEVGKLKSVKGEKYQVARELLSEIWDGYDKGGHSVGRSLRSVLLEAVMKWLDQNQNEKVKVAFSVLIAMHFDYEYINQKGWFDYKLTGIEDTPVRDRIPLCAVAFLLEVDDIPSMEDWPKEAIYELVKG